MRSPSSRKPFQMENPPSIKLTRRKALEKYRVSHRLDLGRIAEDKFKTPFMLCWLNQTQHEKPKIRKRKRRVEGSAPGSKRRLFESPLPRYESGAERINGIQYASNGQRKFFVTEDGKVILFPEGNPPLRRMKATIF